MKIMMEAHAITAWRGVTEDAIKTLTKIAAQTSGWTRESIVLQLDALKASLQEALDSASPAIQVKPAVNESAPVMGEIGRVHCIDVAQHWPEKLRYYGAHNGATGAAHLHVEDAVSDVRNWYAGKPVVYEKQAVTPLVPYGMSWERAAREIETQGIARLAGAAAAGAQSSPPGERLAYLGRDKLAAELQEKRSKTQAALLWNIPAYQSFIIGPDNTYPQVWDAMLAGHQVRLPEWGSLYSWVLFRESQEILLVEGNDRSQWAKRHQFADMVSAKQQLRTDWEVLPIIDHEPPTV